MSTSKWAQTIADADARQAKSAERAEAAKSKTREELLDAIDDGTAASIEFNRRAKEVGDLVLKRVEALHGSGEREPFAADDLVFAATTRCHCDAGLAYPSDIGAHGFWCCSAILMGTAAACRHTEPLPFMFYEVKCELQPSAAGRTTRPQPKIGAAS